MYVRVPVCMGTCVGGCVCVCVQAWVCACGCVCGWVWVRGLAWAVPVGGGGGLVRVRGGVHARRAWVWVHAGACVGACECVWVCVGVDVSIVVYCTDSIYHFITDKIASN